MVFYAFINILDDETGCAVLSAAPWLIAAWGVGLSRRAAVQRTSFIFTTGVAKHWHWVPEGL